MAFISFLGKPFFLDKTKTILQILTSIKGIGDSSAQKFCRSVGVLPSSAFHEITRAQRQFLEESILEMSSKPALFDVSLTRQVRMNQKRLLKIKHFRGIRFNRNLPTRGQRTKSNAKTCRRSFSRRLVLFRVIG